jgi:hypothetical protein
MTTIQTAFIVIVRFLLRLGPVLHCMKGWSND